MRGPVKMCSLALVCMLAMLAMSGLPAMAGGEDRPVTGVLAAASGPVTAGPMGGAPAAMRKLAVGNKVFFEDEIVTGDGVRAQILLRDGTTFSIGEGARLVLDEFVYDPQSRSGGVGVVIKKGAFRFVSGKIAKTNPRNMRVLAGNTAIAVRGTEVIGTVGSGAESVILISGQVDLVSIAGDCVASGSSEGGGDMFGIGADGALEFNADIVASPPDYCNQTLVRPGFGVQVASGQIAPPTRIDTATIDSVIDAITITGPAKGTDDSQDTDASEGDEPAETGTAAEAADSGGADSQEEAPDLAGSDSDPEAPAAQVAVAAAADAGPEEAEDLSEFDKVVMRAFGLIDEETDAAAGDDRTAAPQEQLTLAASRASQDKPGEEDAGDRKPEERDAAGEVKPESDDAELEESVEDTPTEEEKRNEIKVEEAVLDLNKQSGDTGNSGSSGSGSNTNSNTNTTNNAPTLASISGIGFTDTAGDDSFTAVSSTLSGSDSDSGDTLTYSVSGGSADTSLSGFTQSRSGTYGTLYVNGSTGAYRYVPNDSAIEGLKSGASEDFTLSVSDGSASASQTLTASITGADDTLSVAALSGITLTDTAGDDSFGNSTGSVQATERDNADTPAYAISGGSADSSESGFTHSRTGTYGTLYINSGSGAYKFIPSGNAIQRLTSNVSEDFTVTVTSGSGAENRTLTATVAGANDTPVLSAISAISVTDTTASDTFSSTGGTLSASDRDSGQTLTFSATNQQALSGDPNYTHGVQGTYGSFVFNANTGVYRYAPTDALVNAVSTNVTDSFTLTASDSALTSSQTLTVNIAGVDDGPSSLDMQNLSNVSGRQNVSATGLRFGVVTDPEGDAVTDQTSTVNALPAWLSFGNQTLGDGSVQYFWEIGANQAPWRGGTKSMSLKARSSGIDTSATSFSITFACQSDHCGDFVGSTDTETSPSVDDPTNIGAIRTGIKIGSDNFALLTEAERDALFDTSVAADGSFRVIYSSAEAGSGSPAGSWDIDQTVNVDYKSRAIIVTGNVTANNIGYFDGGSDSFVYESTMAYTDTELSSYSVFGKSTDTTGNVTYGLQNTNGDTVHVNLHDQVGFMRDGNGVNAALINTDITPLSSNPVGYKDDTNKLIQQQWRLLEPQ
ncbi:MAG: VCBS domain-containing protein [Candidatus Puniceispirillaceae bacterium]